MARYNATMEAATPTTLPLSVVITSFNRARLLERALRSVKAQRPRQPAQVIVVDDASTDDSPKVAEGFGVELIRHGSNLGAAAAYETGLRAARHEWVALLDDDDEWLPHHLDTIWSLACLTPGSVLVACSCIERAPGSPEHFFHGPLTKEPIVLDSPASLLHPENLVPGSAAMLHRDTALAAGGFRDVLCEDLDMWCRLLSRGSATLSPRVGVLYHTHPGQISDDWEAMHVAHLDLTRSFAGESWRSRALVERRAGVNAWDRFRGLRRRGVKGAGREFARELLRHPLRALGVLEVIRHRMAVRRRTSRLALSGEPSVATLRGVDPSAVPDRERYEVDLSASGGFHAFLRLARRPSTAAFVSTRSQAALVRLTGARPVRVSRSALAGTPTNGSEPGPDHAAQPASDGHGPRTVTPAQPG
jgi:glycosyltransferase involved in cell wall biosynthesis